jgi:hypothetical protein
VLEAISNRSLRTFSSAILAAGASMALMELLVRTVWAEGRNIGWFEASNMAGEVFS